MGVDFKALRNRKIVQWTLAYLAGCWVALEILEYIVGAYEWPSTVLRLGIALAAVGLPVAVVVAWYHGERGQQRVSGVELLILSAVLAAGGLLMTLVTRGASYGPTSRTLLTVNRASAVRY